MLDHLGDKSNRATRPTHAEPKREREAGYDQIRAPGTRVGIGRGESAEHAEMKQECEAKECHLKAKRTAAKVLSGRGEKHQKSGCNHNRERTQGPGFQLPRQPGEPVIIHAEADQAQIQQDHRGQEDGETHQMEGLNHRHAVLTVTDEDERGPI